MSDSLPRRRSRPSGWTGARQLDFVRDLRQSGNVSASCDRVGLSRASLYQLRVRSPEFDRLCGLALAAYREELRQEAMRRALDGRVEPVRYRGRIVGERVVYSDRLLAAALLGGGRAGAVKLTPAADVASRGDAAGG